MEEKITAMELREDLKGQLLLEQFWAYFLGDSVEESEEIALTYLIKSAEEGLRQGQKILADCYFTGHITAPQDFDKGLFWLKKSAEQGHPPALFALFQCLLFGVKEGQLPDDPEIQQEMKGYLAQSAKNGYLPAYRHCFFHLCQTDKNVYGGFNVPLVLEYYHALLDMGDEQGLAFGASSLEEAFGNLEDLHFVLDHRPLRKKAEEGDPQAEYQLALAYKGHRELIVSLEKGNHGKSKLITEPQAYKQTTVYWLKQAAQQGYPPALVALVEYGSVKEGKELLGQMLELPTNPEFADEMMQAIALWFLLGDCHKEHRPPDLREDLNWVESILNAPESDVVNHFFRVHSVISREELALLVEKGDNFSSAIENIYTSAQQGEIPSMVFAKNLCSDPVFGLKTQEGREEYWLQCLLDAQHPDTKYQWLLDQIAQEVTVVSAYQSEMEALAKNLHQDAMIWCMNYFVALPTDGIGELKKSLFYGNLLHKVHEYHPMKFHPFLQEAFSGWWEV